MVCNNLCSKYKDRKISGVGRYVRGVKRCQTCEIFIKWQGLWCPCCNMRLRTKPRNLKYKKRLNELSNDSDFQKNLQDKLNIKTFERISID